MHSLRLKLISPFLIGTIALTIILPAYTYISSYKAVKDSIIIIAEAKSNQISTAMRLMFLSVDVHIQNLVHDANISSIFTKDTNAQDLQNATDWLNIMLNGNSYYRDMNILDDKGVCIVSTNHGHVGTSYIDKNYTKLALQGRFNVGESSIGRITKKFSTITAGPINIYGKIAGVFVIINDLPKIVDYTHHSKYDYAAISTSILTPEGLFETHPDIKIMGNKKMLFPKLYESLKLVDTEGSLVQYSLLDEEYIGYAQLEPTTKWIIITSGKEKEVFAPAYESGLVVLGISLTIMFIVSFIVLKFTNGILVMLLNLINYAKQVSEGHLNIKLKDTNRNDELGTLQRSLQRLVSSLQEMLTETQKASTMKGQFLANMSHEIRTPLNAIIGMTHLTLREGNLTTRVDDFVKKIQISARSLLGLINDILDISKVEAGMIELEFIVFNLRDLINNTILIHQTNADNKKISIIFEYTPNMPTHYYGDPLRIGQILNNIISNAIKFTTEGNVTIKCYEDDLPEYYTKTTGDEIVIPDNSRCVFIAITDSGIGIAEKTLDTLFKPFTQADASISRKYGGTGLGLAISNSLVQLLHGNFHVTSILNEGTTFCFFMQLVPSFNESDMDNIDENLDVAFKNLQLEGKTILIAEDNSINQIIMYELLVPSGATIVIVENGKEAVDYLENELVDLVFMDLQMPIMDGIQATKLIRKFADKTTLPIIAVTANAMKEDKELGFKSGMNQYITKPIEPQRLVEVLSFFLKK